MDVLVDPGQGRAVAAELNAISGPPALFRPTPVAAELTPAANLSNPNTRRAYARAVAPFAAWFEEQGLQDLSRCVRSTWGPTLSSRRGGFPPSP